MYSGALTHCWCVVGGNWASVGRGGVDLHGYLMVADVRLAAEAVTEISVDLGV